ncbi:hypothetical protein F5Y18DRAFT_82771 [Xylariaceae sp. FL1019]|nr:hypothetical protein F5Y18DRAFT_82771 [Xylariaceae sp. FL1019]
MSQLSASKGSSATGGQHHRIPHSSCKMTTNLFTSAPITATTILQNQQTGAWDVSFDSSAKTKTCWQTLPYEIQQEIWRYALHAETTLMELNADKTRLISFKKPIVGQVCYQAKSVQDRINRRSSQIFDSVDSHAWVNFDNTLVNLGSDAKATVDRMDGQFRSRIKIMHIEVPTISSSISLFCRLRKKCASLQWLLVSVIEPRPDGMWFQLGLCFATQPEPRGGLIRLDGSIRPAGLRRIWLAAILSSLSEPDGILGFMKKRNDIDWFPYTA